MLTTSARLLRLLSHLQVPASTPVRRWRTSSAFQRGRFDRTSPRCGSSGTRSTPRRAYSTASEAQTEREVEPYRLALRAGRWYLLAWDPLRNGWRTFRADRVQLKTPNGRRFVARAEPPEGFDAYLVKHIESATWQQRYRVRLAAPASMIRERAPISVEVTADGPGSCSVTVGSDSVAAGARYLSWWEVPFTVLDSDELKTEVRLLAKRYAQAAEG